MNAAPRVGMAAAVVLAAAIAAAPAQAAKRARAPAVVERITIVDETGRTRTRVTVRPRSFLDPGTEVLPMSRSYTDYAFPPGARTYLDRNDVKGSFSRMPLPGPWDVPGWR